MPRRDGWFVVVRSVDGATFQQPVENQRQVLMWVERLAPVVPLSSTWSVEYVR